MFSSSVSTTVASTRFDLLNTDQQSQLNLLYMAYDKPDEYEAKYRYELTPPPFKVLSSVKYEYESLKRQAGNDLEQQAALKDLFLGTGADVLLGQEPQLPALQGKSPHDTFANHCKRMLVTGVVQQLQNQPTNKLS